MESKGYRYEIKDAEKDFLPATRKGSLIVQYIGEDKDIMSDLTDILGEQFAGY